MAGRPRAAGSPPSSGRCSPASCRERWLLRRYPGPGPPFFPFPLPFPLPCCRPPRQRVARWGCWGSAGRVAAVGCGLPAGDEESDLAAPRLARAGGVGVGSTRPGSVVRVHPAADRDGEPRRLQRVRRVGHRPAPRRIRSRLLSPLEDLVGWRWEADVGPAPRESRVHDRLPVGAAMPRAEDGLVGTRRGGRRCRALGSCRAGSRPRPRWSAAGCSPRTRSRCSCLLVPVLPAAVRPPFSALLAARSVARENGQT